jgi:hypothetical protein
MIDDHDNVMPDIYRLNIVYRSDVISKNELEYEELFIDEIKLKEAVVNFNSNYQRIVSANYYRLKVENGRLINGEFLGFLARKGELCNLEDVRDELTKKVSSREQNI